MLRSSPESPSRAYLDEGLGCGVLGFKGLGFEGFGFWGLGVQGLGSRF